MLHGFNVKCCEPDLVIISEESAAEENYKQVSPRQKHLNQRFGEKDDHEYLYWIYSGNAEIFINGTKIYHIDRKRGKSIECVDEFGLLVGDQFLMEIDNIHKNRSNKRTRRKIRSGNKDKSGLNIQRMTVKSGEKGSKIMRINTDVILKLMENDENLDTSIRYLLLIGAQRIVGAFLSNTSETSKE